MNDQIDFYILPVVKTFPESYIRLHVDDDGKVKEDEAHHQVLVDCQPRAAQGTRIINNTDIVKIKARTNFLVAFYLNEQKIYMQIRRKIKDRMDKLEEIKR